MVGSPPLLPEVPGANGLEPVAVGNDLQSQDVRSDGVTVRVLTNNLFLFSSKTVGKSIVFASLSDLRGLLMSRRKSVDKLAATREVACHATTATTARPSCRTKEHGPVI